MREHMEDLPVPPGDDAAIERYRQTALNPLVPRRASEELLAAMNRLVEATTPDPRLPGPLNFSRTRPLALGIKRAIEEALAERDAADRAEPRRRELPERVGGALSAMTGCISRMQELERTRSGIETAARAQGFAVSADGTVSLGEEHRRAGAIGDDLGRQRARYEHQMMSVQAEMMQVQERAVTAIRERLGADEPGIPWVILECARGGFDLSATFESGARLPASPLRDLMERLAADTARAKAAVWPQPRPKSFPE
ncbi:hypothetical protein MSM1_02165 [Mycobacterium sp. SM1]|uniref:hypothetical protein n=1 Tax=Mycobacterium sp. SM1 TaxID=2816243 RepID=UPI001BD01B72|nr:hypothetical protein [Mycobacterium sp. SM1]MBS4727215.1 hypothetical protein [Mycobacterium sp. SM1]